MPKSVSVGLCLIGSYAALSAYGRGGTAVSAEANTARRAADALAKSVERSQALFGQKAAALSRLQEIANESSEENWDGYGARAVGRGAVLNAQDFIRSLPEMIPIP